MAIPKVGVRRIKRKNGYVFQLDYTFNGKRIREIVESSRAKAELLFALIVAPCECRTSASLSFLIICSVLNLTFPISILLVILSL